MRLTIEHGARAADVLVTEAVEGIYRVERDGRTVGYVHRVGGVYVALNGPVYNTAIEVAQTHDLESAADRVARG